METQIKFNGTIYNGYVYVNGEKLTTEKALPAIREWFVQKTLEYYNCQQKDGNAALKAINIEETEIFQKFSKNILEKGTVEYMTKSGSNTPSFAAAQLAGYIKQTI